VCAIVGPYLIADNEPTQDTDTSTLSVSDWARQYLDFHPSPKQAELLDSPGKYLILCCNRQWGKTTAMAVKALHAAIHTPKTTIVILSRSKEQAGILIERATELVITLGLPVRRVLGQSFSLKLPNGSRICAVPHTQDTSLGRTANILIVDEAAAVKDESLLLRLPLRQPHPRQNLATVNSVPPIRLLLQLLARR